MASVKTDSAHSISGMSVEPAAKRAFEEFYGTSVSSTCRKVQAKNCQIKINSGEIWNSATQDERLLTVLHKLNHFHERPSSSSKSELPHDCNDTIQSGVVTRASSLRSSKKHEAGSASKIHHASLKPKRPILKPRRAATMVSNCARITRSMKRKCSSIDNVISSSPSTSNESQELYKIFEQAKHAGFVVPSN
eukprot:767578-Hanusia_phi.AAC.3